MPAYFNDDLHTLIYKLTSSTEQVESGPSYDVDAEAWVTRVALAGGVLSSPGYSEEYTKAAFNNFFVSLKSQSLWPLLDELAVFGVGVGNLSAGTTKMKFVTSSVLTNGNFTSLDLTSSGTSIGLKGDGSTKYLGVNLNANTIDQNDCSLGVYVTNSGTLAITQCLIGNGTSSSFFVRYLSDNTSHFRLISNVQTSLSSASRSVKGIVGGTRLSLTQIGFNRTTSNTATIVAGTVSGAIDIFRLGAMNVQYFTGSLSMYWIGKNLDSTKRAAFSTILNTLHAAFGFTP